MNVITLPSPELLRNATGRKRTSLQKELRHQIIAGETSLFRFIRGCPTCSLWSSIDDNGEPLDSDFQFDDIATESLVSAWVECSQFCMECAYYLSHQGDDQNGHDFWLTRNHHGAGYWDRAFDDESAEIAMQQLTHASHGFGEVDLYLGDDKKLHFASDGNFS